jgi:hypothetical protein
MHTLVIEVDEELVVHANERFVMEFRERDGKLVAERVSPLGGEQEEDRQRAAEEWLQESTGLLSGMANEEADEARYEYLAAKHLK